MCIWQSTIKSILFPLFVLSVSFTVLSPSALSVLSVVHSFSFHDFSGSFTICVIRAICGSLFFFSSSKFHHIDRTCLYDWIFWSAVIIIDPCKIAVAVISLSAGSPWNCPGSRVDWIPISGVMFTHCTFGIVLVRSIHSPTSYESESRSFWTNIPISHALMALT